VLNRQASKSIVSAEASSLYTLCYEILSDLNCLKKKGNNDEENDYFNSNFYGQHNGFGRPGYDC
jgi:hypothetical protein